MHRIAFWFFGLVFVLSTMLASTVYIQAQTITPGQVVKWFDADGNLTDSVITESDSGNIGIGTTAPAGRLQIESALDTIGTILNLPTIPNLPDPTYTHQAVMQWQGGEEKFGNWRNYFNAFEQDWALTYNAPWNYTNNMWLGRDSGDARANIAAYMRFNVAEGNSGANTFEITFAPPAAAGVPPDWNAASQYWFYDGRITPLPARPARFRIRGAANMDAVLSLIGHGSVSPLSMELTSDGVSKRFKLGRVDRDGIGDVISENNFLAIKTETGDIGIGTLNPTAKLHVIGDFVATGSKSALVETASYGKRQLYAVESPENWFEDFGSAKLMDGQATIKLDPMFAETVNTESNYHVFLTPKGDCEGLYVANQTATSFEVRELRKGKNSIAFDYRIVAKRKGYEQARLAEVKDREKLRAHR